MMKSWQEHIDELERQGKLDDSRCEVSLSDLSTNCWVEAYRQTPIGTGHWAYRIASYTPSVEANVSLEWPVVWSEGRLPQYAQGMARGYWWGKSAGRHPGYVAC